MAALQWIHDNIAAFGGDPDNVTLFGQSGGGGKISSLLQTPAADGLFHKCIIMSGIADGIMFQEGDSRPLIDGMLKELGLTATEVDMLETLPYEQLAAAYNKVSPEYPGCRRVRRLRASPERVLCGRSQTGRVYQTRRNHSGNGRYSFG